MLYSVNYYYPDFSTISFGSDDIHYFLDLDMTILGQDKEGMHTRSSYNYADLGP